MSTIDNPGYENGSVLQLATKQAHALSDFLLCADMGYFRDPEVILVTVEAIRANLRQATALINDLAEGLELDDDPARDEDLVFGLARDFADLTAIEQAVNEVFE